MSDTIQILLKEVFGDKAEIHSFEPSRKTFQKLQSNAGNKAGINLYNFGFGDENNKAVLFSDSDESGLPSVYKRKLDHFNIDMGQVKKSRSRLWIHFARIAGSSGFNFLKSDGEGHEKSFRRLFKNAGIRRGRFHSIRVRRL